MQRFSASLLTILWVALLAPAITYTSTVVVVADDFIGEAINLDNLIALDENVELPVDDDHIEDTSNDDVHDNDIDIDIIIDNFIGTIKDDDVDSSVYDETVDENSTTVFKRLKNNNRLTDILVACFFFIAAIWLILATVYSVILLVLLRLQARGELDIYDEDLGRVTVCNGRLMLNFGCILRRYAIQLEEVSTVLKGKIMVSDAVSNTLYSGMMSNMLVLSYIWYDFFSFDLCRIIINKCKDAMEILAQKTKSMRNDHGLEL